MTMLLRTMYAYVYVLQYICLLEGKVEVKGELYMT